MGTTSRHIPVVMHVVHSVEPGGTERVLCRLVRALGGAEARHLICSLRAQACELRAQYCGYGRRFEGQTNN